MLLNIGVALSKSANENRVGNVLAISGSFENTAKLAAFFKTKATKFVVFSKQLPLSTQCFQSKHRKISDIFYNIYKKAHLI